MGVEPAVHRTILMVDVEKSSDSARTDAQRVAVHDEMYKALQQSLAMAGIGLADRTIEDRGDGASVILAPEVPKDWLVTRLPTYLAETLARYNAAHPAQAQVRLRLVLHAGEMYRGGHEFTTSIDQASRLLDAQAVKAALRDSSDVVTLIVSDSFYDEVVRHYPSAEPSRFRQASVVMKETTTSAWVRVLGDQEAAHRDKEQTAFGSVFISYSHADAKIVETLFERLSEAGVDVSRDIDLPAGSNFSTVLVDAIGRSDFVIAVVSPDYLASDWAQGELAAALSSQKRVLPILVRPTAVEGPLQYIQLLDVTSEPQLAGEKLIQLLTSTPSSTSPGAP